MPDERKAEFFGFFAVSGKLSAMFGPLLFSIAALLTGSGRSGIFSHGRHGKKARGPLPPVLIIPHFGPVAQTQNALRAGKRNSTKSEIPAPLTKSARHTE
ncbi:MAG: hypothetical protein BLM47_05560 [Candidatus Reconcilbacillus cellulovorans]|uniref:Uncharacterized protein n=1 Tax=Candidatus Reconcilbacillus cellulovorans TaxID=1906605 RepID=A0A2A6E0E7_9BACL|nr:MAG: hypothetical protein BLM47_05560 [Candidatus Reconcilbacillus cellulovorans]